MKRREGRVVRQTDGADRRADLRRSAHGGLARPPETRRRRRRRRRPRDVRRHVIPFEYRLRPGVRVETAADGSRRVVSGLPLSVLRVNAAAARLLERTRGGVSVGRLAADLALSEDKCLDALRDLPPPGDPGGPRRAGSRRRHALRQRDRAHQGPRERARGLPGRARGPGVSGRTCSRSSSSTTARPTRARWRVWQRRTARVCWSTRATAVRPSRATARRERPPARSSPSSTATASPRPAGCGRSRRTSPGSGWARWGGARWATTTRRDSTATRRSLRRWTWDRACCFAAEGADGLYVPTCNLLVRRSVYRELGGLRETLRVGEDVDLCWRLRERGHVLVYAPEGVVRHKHLGRLGAMLRRRADYGSSEATLHALHPDKHGRLRLPPASAATVALVSAAVVTRRPWVLAAALAPPALDAARRQRRLRRNGVEVPGRADPVLHAARPPVGAVLRLLPAGALLPLAAGGRRRRRARRVAAGGARRRLRRRRRLHDGADLGSACPRIWVSTSPSTRRIRPG